MILPVHLSLVDDPANRIEANLRACPLRASLHGVTTVMVSARTTGVAENPKTSLARLRVGKTLRPNLEMRQNRQQKELRAKIPAKTTCARLLFNEITAMIS